jgi:hypothetical protein
MLLPTGIAMFMNILHIKNECQVKTSRVRAAVNANCTADNTFINLRGISQSTSRVIITFDFPLSLVSRYFCRCRVCVCLLFMRAAAVAAADDERS